MTPAKPSIRPDRIGARSALYACVTHFSVYAVVPAVAELTPDVSPQRNGGEQAQLTHDVTLENLSALTGVEVRIWAKGLVNDAPALLFICMVDVASGATPSPSEVRRTG